MTSIKQLEKETIAYLKKTLSPEGYAFASDTFYKKEKDFFIHVVFLVAKIEKMPHLVWRMHIKPYEYDNIFWENLDMAENIKRKDSLRATGAFTAPSYKYGECIIELDDVPSSCESAIKDFTHKTETFLSNLEWDIHKFNKFILESEGIRRGNLLKVLANIQMKDYKAAMNIAKTELENGENGGYQNNGKDIYEHIMLNYS
ncbi:hypothetical protein [Sporosarcina cyprini]|uniref:hypothetical protein n=1 Tax=Sporosarcina cyprini TaxID=2910523 RepID=UPI001EE0D92D|nr:hypothetical protein [Sporosarcina cyprini]MCG3087959.1 hypothetical protein [Sporosarcina cyprini]